MKKVLFVVALVISAASAQASYLYWELYSEITMQNTGAKYDFPEDGGINYAQVHVLYKGEEVEIADVGQVINGQYSSLELENNQVTSAGKYVVDIGDISTDTTSYSFYVEYTGFDASYGVTMVGAGEETTYTSLASSIVDYNSSGLIPIEQANIWHGGTANAPEPTSAMLMLLGVAGLALKRKQRKLA